MVAIRPQIARKTRVRISKSGQVTLPADIRRSLGVDVGDQVDIIMEQDGRVSVEPVTTLTAAEMAGMFGPRPEGIEIEDLIREATHEGMDRRIKRWMT